MALISTHTIDTDGTAPAFAAAAAGDTAETGNRVFLIVRNAHASEARTVTIAGQGDLETGDPYPDKAYSVAAQGERWIPLLPIYRNENGQAELSYSSTADLTRAVVRI
ncbi:hypothetical protein [Thermomonospora amylolytica]|uniref:hypothetical protein n=1 Tax=Thermomonospora amylolytica TaxID=1411117 RepID=UPI000E6BCAAE|nr:hypothetical protein [Thermomonospora amylolytica]